MNRYYLVILVFAASLAACSTTDGDNNTSDNNVNNANNGKGDTPNEEALTSCTKRNADVLSTGRETFTPDFVRWSCADVEGVTGRDRGQEYCEMGAVIRVPDELGETLVEEGIQIGPRGTVSVDLNDDQLFYLEDNGNEVVGSCFFTSWHRDVTAPYPACAEGECPTLHGVTVDDKFKMEVGFNSNGAASDLVQRCVSRTVVEDYGPNNNFENEFMRGCMMVADLFGTEWRRSDPSICAAAMRLSECGCFVTDDPEADLGFALVPSVSRQQDAGGISLRGFPLGTWSGADQLPSGCSYVDVGSEANGQPGQTLVECPIRGNELIGAVNDPTEFCRNKYAQDVVVHVPIPGGAITCEPPADGVFAHTCSDMPWVVTQTEEAETREECCRVCKTSQACGDACISMDNNCSADPGCACQE